MDIHHLKVFASVYKNRSFSKASKENNISQPTISEHIKNLEAELGCRLFDRMGRSILPTKEADMIYPKALEIVEELEKLRESVTLVGGKVKGHLVIGASTIPGTYILPLMLSEFKEINPDVSFEILIEDSKRITDMVLNHEVILGVVGAVMEPERLAYIPFHEDELVLAVAPSFALSGSITTRQLVNIPFILRETGSGTRKTMETILGKHKLGIKDLHITAILGSTSSVKQAIIAGLGASVLSRVAIRDELKRGTLKEVKIKGMTMTRSFYLINHKKRTLPNPHSAFYDYIQRKL